MNPETETLQEEKGVALAVQNRSVALMSDTFVPRDLSQLKELASFLAASDLIPKSLGGRKENVAIVLMMGHEIGVPGVAALSNIYVVNGRPSIYGELATALVRRSGLVEKLSFSFEGTGPTLQCIAVGQRKGDKETHTITYSWAQAMLAGLPDKNPNYHKSPQDMIMWKALHRLYKFLWPDVLKGLVIREIASEEIQEAEVVPQVVVEAPRQAQIGPAPAPAAPVEAKRKAGRPPKANPTPAPAEVPTELTPEEIEAKVAAAKERFDADKKKEEYQDNGFAPDKPVEKKTNSVKGIITRALRLSNPTTKEPMGFGIGIEVGTDKCSDEEIYMVESQEYAMAMRPLVAEKTVVELFFEPLETPVPSVHGKVLKYEVVK